MNQKRRGIVAIILIAIIIVCVIGIIMTKPAGKKVVDEKKETMQSLDISSVDQEKETETSEPSRTIDNVDIIFLEKVPKDSTGNMRLAKVKGNKSAEEYPLDYSNTYFKDDNEVHAIVNYTLNTTACITSVGNKINVRIYEHRDGEESDAKELFTGEKYAEYNIDKETGTVEKIE